MESPFSQRRLLVGELRAPSPIENPSNGQTDGRRRRSSPDIISNSPSSRRRQFAEDKTDVTSTMSNSPSTRRRQFAEEKTSSLVLDSPRMGRRVINGSVMQPLSVLQPSTTTNIPPHHQADRKATNDALTVKLQKLTNIVSGGENATRSSRGKRATSTEEEEKLANQQQQKVNADNAFRKCQQNNTIYSITLTPPTPKCTEPPTNSGNETLMADNNQDTTITPTTNRLLKHTRRCSLDSRLSGGAKKKGILRRASSDEQIHRPFSKPPRKTLSWANDLERIRVFVDEDPYKILFDTL